MNPTALACLALVSLCNVSRAGGDLLVASWNNSAVLRYDGGTGAFVGTFVAAGAGGLSLPHSATYGPDGNLYVTSFANDRVLRYDGQSGSFIDAFVSPGLGGLDGPTSAEFGADGHLYVSSFATPGVLRFDGVSGAFLGTFIGPGNGLVNAESGRFGPNGNYYLANSTGNNVLEYDGLTGAFVRVFAAGGGLTDVHETLFGPNGNLFATAFGNRRVNEYDGLTGALVRTFVGSGNGLIGAHGMAFPGDGFFYVAAFGRDRVLRYDELTGTFDSVFVPDGSGGLSGPISILVVPAPPLVTRYGCGVNPAGSLQLAGQPTLGATLDFEIDNPLGTQAPGAASFLWLALAPNLAFPCGASVNGFGMSAPGAAGELLVQPPTFLAASGPPWAGAGQPALIQVTIPPLLSLLELEFFAQGALRDASAPAGARFGLTDALALRIGL